MKHISYPKIPQIGDAIYGLKLRLSYIGKDENDIPIYAENFIFPTVKFEGTVKLHGTNASVVYDNGNIYAQSRDTIITPTSDNAGFAFFTESNKDLFLKVFENIKNIFKIDNKKIVIFGEWVGKKIQKGVAISGLDKSLFVFGLKTVDENENVEWLDFKNLDFSSIPKVYNIMDYPRYCVEIDLNNSASVEDYLNKITDEVENECPVAKAFGISGIGEGIVWKSLLEDGTLIKFKTKGKKHQVVNKGENKNISIDNVKLNSIKEFIDYAVTENRVKQGISVVCGNDRPDKSKLGDFMKWIINDVITEEGKELYKNNLDPKEVNKHISDRARTLFLEIANKF